MEHRATHQVKSLPEVGLRHPLAFTGQLALRLPEKLEEYIRTAGFFIPGQNGVCSRELHSPDPLRIAIEGGPLPKHLRKAINQLLSVKSAGRDPGEVGIAALIGGQGDGAELVGI